MTRILFFIACAGSALPFMASCTEIPKPAQADSGPWPVDDWKPPTMHTFDEQLMIMQAGHHICEYTDKGDCALMVKRVKDVQVHRLPDGTVNVE